MMTLTIPTDLGKRITFLAAKSRMAQDEYALEALAEILEDREDLLDAIDVIERIKRGEEKLVPYEDVKRRLKNANKTH